MKDYQVDMMREHLNFFIEKYNYKIDKDGSVFKGEVQQEMVL